MTRLLASLLLLAACGTPEDTEPTETQSPTGDTDEPTVVDGVYTAGRWSVTYSAIEDTRCGAFVLDEARTIQVDIEASETAIFAYDAEDQQSSNCERDGADFVCAQIDQEIDIDGYDDAEVSRSADLEGTFTSTTTLEGTWTVRVACEGDDCSAVAADKSYGGSLPCRFDQDLAGTWEH